MVDKIIVHGKSLKTELLETFPTIPETKIFTQRFGVDIRNFACEPKQCSAYIVDKLSRYDGLHLLFFGDILNEKALERLLKFWNLHAQEYPNCILSVVGKVSETNEMYIREMQEFKKIENKLLIEIGSYLTMEDHNYLYNDADILILPYRKGSMSAVIKIAAAFRKTVLCTDVGCFREYLEDGEDSIIVPNNYESIENGLLNVLNTMNKNMLKEMGNKLHENFYKKSDWNDIVRSELLPIYNI